MSPAERTNDRATKSTPIVSANFEIGKILLRQGRDGDGRAGHVDALVGVDAAPDRDLAVGASRRHLLDLQVDESVVDEDVLPGPEHLGEYGRADRKVAEFPSAPSPESTISSRRSRA